MSEPRGDGALAGRQRAMTQMPLRVRGALLLLVLAALLPLRASGRRIAAYLSSPPGDDAITLHERRLAPVRDALVALGVKEVGYLPRTAVRGDPSWQRSDPHYMSTRYALAPVMVFPDSARALIFADLAVESDPGGGIPADLDVVRRFDDRMVLLQRRAR